MPNEIDNQMNRTHDFDEPSVQMSVASSFYGGGVTITGGGPDEVSLMELKIGRVPSWIEFVGVQYWIVLGLVKV